MHRASSISNPIPLLNHHAKTQTHNKQMTINEQTTPAMQTDSQTVLQSEIEIPVSKMSSEPLPDPLRSHSDLHDLLNTGSYRLKEERALIQRRTVEPATTHTPEPGPNPLECVISASLAATSCLSQCMRTGKIARLPKLERDMVNKLLHNYVPYSRIVAALDELGITVTERNISNWRTRGGYKEWCAEQENQLRLAHLQDHLTDYLRKHDAQQLPEVGLQVASTQLTSLLMNPQTSANLLADPNKYAKIIEALDKCSVRLNELQKERYENLRDARIRGTVSNLRCEEQKAVETIRQAASATHGRSAYEDDIPHRNDLPPREELRYVPPRPTYWERMTLQSKEHVIPKLPTNSAPDVAQTTPSGNPE